MRKQMKRLEFDIEDGGVFIRTPTDGSAAADGDNMTIVVYGQKTKSGQWLQVEASVSRHQIVSLAQRMHEVIRLEQKKVDEKRAAMRGNA